MLANLGHEIYILSAVVLDLLFNNISWARPTQNIIFILYAAMSDGWWLTITLGWANPCDRILIFSANTIVLDINILGLPNSIVYKYISAHPILYGISAEISQADNIRHLSNLVEPIISDWIC